MEHIEYAYYWLSGEPIFMQIIGAIMIIAAAVILLFVCMIMIAVVLNIFSDFIRSIEGAITDFQIRRFQKRRASMSEKPDSD